MIWLPGWLYERMPLVYLLSAVLCLGFFGLNPVSAFSAGLLVACSILVWFARRRARRGRVPLLPEAQGLAMPSQSVAMRAARRRAALKQIAVTHRGKAAPGAADFSDTWAGLDEAGASAPAGIVQRPA